MVGQESCQQPLVSKSSVGDRAVHKLGKGSIGWGEDGDIGKLTERVDQVKARNKGGEVGQV